MKEELQCCLYGVYIEVNLKEFERPLKGLLFSCYSELF